MEAIKNGEADYAVLPIENSSAGIVSENYDLLVEYDNYIVGEQIIRIDHALLGLEDADERDIRTVYSHKQSLMQCSEFLDNSCRRILDREYRIIRFPVLNGLHGIFPALHMEIIAVFSKKLFHGKLAVGTFESLKNNPCIGIIQRVNRLKLLRRHNSMLRQQFLLFLTAHRHDLLKKRKVILPDTESVNFLSRSWR